MSDIFSTVNDNTTTELEGIIIIINVNL